MNYRRLLAQLRIDEGFNPEPYQDSVGVWTQGYGTTAGVTADSPPITVHKANELLMSGAYTACLGAQHLFDNFNQLDDTRQEVLVNMAYNLGRGGLARFVKLRKAVQDKDFVEASHEMFDSKWFMQVSNRAMRLQEQMLRGNSTGDRI